MIPLLNYPVFLIVNCCYLLLGYKKSTIKSMALMDFEKINMDLIETLIEFIVDGEHQVSIILIITFTFIIVIYVDALNM